MKFADLEKRDSAVKGRMAIKKEEKKKAILASAYTLFVEKGTGKTSIDDIVKGAGLAKGTFYLYFKDKDDLLDYMVYGLCFDAVGNALSALDSEHEKDPNMEIGDSVCFFAQKLLDILIENRELLPIIHKNLFKGLYSDKKDEESQLSLRCEDSIIARVVSHFESEFVSLGGTIFEARKRMYMIVEIVNAVAYNAVIEEVPYSFNEIKPLLLKTIRALAYPDFN